MAATRRMANRPNLVHELETAQDRLWDANRLRRAADDVVRKLIKGGLHSEREYLTAQLAVAHAHMVCRDIAEQAVMTAFEARRPVRVDAGRARDLLTWILSDFVWHSSELNSILRRVRDRCEHLGDAERARRHRRVGSRFPASDPAVVTPSHAPMLRAPTIHR